MPYITKFCLLIVFPVFLCGCSPAPIHVHINSGQILNQDQQGNSLPVQIKIYQLRNRDAFTQATFRELWQQDSTTLGNSMLDKRELMVDPGRRVIVILNRDQDSKYLGVVAIFRTPHGNTWRTITAIRHNYRIIALNIKVDLHNNKVILRS